MPPRPIRALLIAVALCVLLLLVLHFNPVPGYWTAVYERFGLYTGWPWLFLVPALLFWVVGPLSHRRTGLGLAAPRIAAAGTAIVFCTVIFLLRVWSSDWSPARSVATLALLGVLAALMLWATFAYAEVWRHRRLHPAIVQDVRRALETGRFLRETRRRLQRADTFLLPPSTWGSMHCLYLVRAHYDACKAEVIGAAGALLEWDAWTKYVRAADTLIEYLALDWPAGDDWSAWQMAEVRREMITAGLWFLRTDAPRLKFPAHRDAEWIKGRLARSLRIVARWIGLGAHADRPTSLRRLIPDAYKSYRVFLTMVFQTSLTEGGTADDPEREQRLIKLTLSAFEPLAKLRPLPSGAGAAEVGATTWLALTAGHLPIELRFDLWRALRGMQAGGLFVARPADEDDVARRLGRVALADMYQG